jgi:hypothetical protein
MHRKPTSATWRRRCRSSSDDHESSS